MLEVKDGKALIISEKIIESRPYSYITNVWIVTWENSDLRAYLNGEFYNSFKSTHKSRISTTTVKNNDNQWYGTPGGADTQDKIFLLSLEEVVKYFGDSGKLKNRPANDVHVFRDEFNDKRNVGRWWWLRSPGNRSNYAAYVGRDGTVFVNGEDVSGMVVCDGDIDDDSGVRPALWLNL
ncbi:MAG: DUF6273 domain-containing protein [Oscillospiraceae bacterium]|nr:DUF6273 domain-containing protein [Oscillospiraceae bacterium]